MNRGGFAVVTVLLVALAVITVSAVVWYFSPRQSNSPPQQSAATPIPSQVREVVKGFLGAGRNFVQAKPFLTDAFAGTIDRVGFEGTSNPHPGYFEIQNVSTSGNEESYNVLARVYQEYTGEGELGYSDNTYSVVRNVSKYLINNIRYGTWVPLEFSPALMKAIETNVVPKDYNTDTGKSGYNVDSAKIFVAHFEAGGPEYVLVTAKPLKYDPSRCAGFLGIIPLAGERNYQAAATLLLDQTGTCASRVPQVVRLIDANGDGEREFVLDLGYGGASTEAFGIFRFNSAGNVATWLKIESQDGGVRPSEFLEGSSASHGGTYDFRDLAGDGKEELVLYSSMLKSSSLGPPLGTEDFSWSVQIYRLNRDIFEYSVDLMNKHADSLLKEYQQRILKGYTSG